LSLDILVLLISLLVTFASWEIVTLVPQGQVSVIVFIIGITASFLLFAMVYALGRSTRKESDLITEHARLLAAIESVPIGMIIADTKGQIIVSNSELSRILGESGEGWTMEKIEETIGSVYSVRKSYDDILAKRSITDRKEIVYESKHLSIFLAPISSGEGIQGVLIVIQDVTNL